MTKNKEVKNQIDNLKLDDVISYEWTDYILTEIDDLYELASTTVKEKYIYLSYEDLFDLFY